MGIAKKRRDAEANACPDCGNTGEVPDPGAESEVPTTKPCPRGCFTPEIVRAFCSAGVRFRLAAQAPAMARLLLARQYDRYGACIECDTSEANGCLPSCELARVLRAAGVLP